MKTTSYERTVGVECNTIERFNQECDAVARSLANAGVKYERLWNMNRGQHCCYFIYSETVYIPETIEDEYKLRGEEKYCGDCPFFVFSGDGTLGDCTNPGVHIKTRTGKLTATGKACARLYEGLGKGELVTDESWRLE